MRAVSRIATLQAGRRYVWRGVPDWRWRVQSSLVRELLEENGELPIEDQVRKRELKLIRDARDWRIAQDLGDNGTDQHVLAILQHHGAPTRLLDVTSNPMTALWFACQKSNALRKCLGVLLAFDVTDIELLRTLPSELPRTWGTVNDPLSWHLEHALQESSKDGKPFLVEPSLPDARMRAQEGLFITGAVPHLPTVNGVDALPLTAAQPPSGLDELFALDDRGRGRPRTLPFVVVAIPTQIKSKMRTHLATTYNRSQKTMFPDVAGFADAVRRGLVD
jgi:FRG domain